MDRSNKHLALTDGCFGSWVSLSDRLRGYACGLGLSVQAIRQTHVDFIDVRFGLCVSFVDDRAVARHGLHTWAFLSERCAWVFVQKLSGSSEESDGNF